MVLIEEAELAAARKGTSTGATATTASYDGSFLESQREALEKELDLQRRLVDTLRAELSQLTGEAAGEVGGDDEFGEGSSVSVDVDRDKALLAGALARVEEVDLALRRMAADAYGRCRHCGQLIAKARMTAVPWADQCVGCKTGGLLSRSRLRASA